MAAAAASTATSGVKTIKMFLEAVIKSGCFDKHLNKVQIIAGGNGSLTASMKIEKEHCNARGSLHGAFSALLVDSLSSAALFTHPSEAVAASMTGVSVQINMTYIKGIPIGEEVLIKSTTDKVGKTLAFMTVELFNRKNGDLIAKGTQTKFIGSGSGNVGQQPESKL